MPHATPRLARVINDRLALDLLLDRGALTAAQLRTLTGLSRPTVADLLDRLQRAGLVSPAGESDVVRRGPNARLYELVADRAHVAGLDVRTDSVTMTVADITGRTVAEWRLEPEAPGPAATTIDRIVTRLAAEEPHAVTVGAPGLVDPGTGELRSTGWPPRWHADLVTALRARLAGPVTVENEVNLAAIAEHRLGVARDVDTFVLLWLGYGVGAGAVLDGRLRRGASGGTGEIGFLAVPGSGGLPAVNDCSGGFHGLAGGAAVTGLARAHGVSAPDAAAAVAAAAGSPGERHRAFLDDLAANVALGALAICVVLDPGCLVLGGEIGRAGGAALAERVADRLATLAPLRTEVRASVVPASAVLAGAVLTALDTARADLFGPQDIPPQRLRAL